MRTFFTYRRPMRTWRTVIELVVVSAILAMCVVVGIRTMNRPELGAVAAVLGIVAFSVRANLAWAFVTGAVEVVQVTERGLSYNGNQWPWKQVTRFNATVFTRSQTAVGTVTVKRPGRSLLSIPFELSPDETTAILELREYLTESGYHFPWQVKLV
jgi:hypothetical protein